MLIDILACYCTSMYVRRQPRGTEDPRHLV